MFDITRPTRTLAILCALVQVLQTLQNFVQRLYYLSFDVTMHANDSLFAVFSGLWGMWNVVWLVLLLGLVLSCDRRLIPGLLFVLWLGVSPLSHLQSWFFEMPMGAAYAIWILLELVWVGVLASVAVVQSDQPVPAVGTFVGSVVLLALSFGLRLASVELEPLFMGLSFIRGAVMTGGFVLLANAARPAERSHLGWPLVLLGILPLLRIWLALDARLGQGSYGGMDSWMLGKLGGVELALFGLIVLAFVGVSRRGVDATPVLVALGGSALLAVATGLLSWKMSSDYRWGRDFAWLLFAAGAGTIVANFVVLFLQIRTLRALAAHLDDIRLVLRADTTLGIYGLVVALGGAAVALVVVSGGRDPVTGGLVLLLGLGLIVASLAAMGMWMFLCLGLARRLDDPEDPENPGDRNGVPAAR